jgi:uncharacterized protein (DUF362 family)
MVRSKVALVKRSEQETTQGAVWRALDLIGAAASLSPFASFLFKPTYVVDKSPMSGLTTRPESLDGIITYLFRKVGKTPAQVLILCVDLVAHTLLCTLTPANASLPSTE